MANIHPDLIRIAARQVRIWRGGDGPPLFLIHGGLGDASWHWHTVWEALADTFALAAPDLPGFGSTVELPNTSFSELIQWLARVQELIGMAQVALVGNSFGAGLARLYASAVPARVTHLVLVDGGQIPRQSQAAQSFLSVPFLSPLAELLQPQPFSETTIRRAFANSALVTPEVLSGSLEASHSFNALMRQVTASPVPMAQTPSAPTLLIWGENDRLASIKRAEAIAAETSALELAIIKNAGHMPQLEDPLSFVNVVKQFCLANETKTLARNFPD